MNPVEERILARATQLAKRIALPEVLDHRVVEARRRLEDEGIAEVVWIEDPTTDPRYARVCEHIYTRRQ
ncbi:MAG: phosphate acyltransferase, partial [Planctomycetota bacterium]